MVITISKNDLNAIDMAQYTDPIKWSPKCMHYFDWKAGMEVYRLLCYLSQQLPAGSKIVDIGTHLGSSATALATNPNCSVITYDLTEQIKMNVDITTTPTIYDVKNITYIIKNCLEDVDVLSSASLIYLDVDPHDGKQEVKFLEQLRKCGFRGILILDDIHVNSGMKTMWDNIPEPKKDITEYGHASGTGIVYFSDDYRVDFV